MKNKNLLKHLCLFILFTVSITAFGQNFPHEVKPLLARRAIKPQLVTVVQCQFTVVQPHGGHALADTGVCIAHIRAERRNFADGCNGRGFSGACHAREEYFVFVQVMYWVKC